jgi:hypothetical protein
MAASAARPRQKLHKPPRLSTPKQEGPGGDVGPFFLPPSAPLAPHRPRTDPLARDAGRTRRRNLTALALATSAHVVVLAVLVLDARESLRDSLGCRREKIVALIRAEKNACAKDDDGRLYRIGKGPYPGIFALGKKRKPKGWND